MNNEAWRSENESAIRMKLAPLSGLRDGVIHERRTKFQHAVVEKNGRQIGLYFTDPSSASSHHKKSGYMSRLDMDYPLDLVALYTRALLLCLLWAPEPKRICILGFGGGRLAMVLHHYFPELLLDCVEIDQEIIDISADYFGIETGGRLRCIVQDAREYIETLPGSRRYDCIIVDCFSGAGHHPGPLSTVEFYRACIDKLVPGGVLATNILKSDPMFRRKAATLASVFPVMKYFRHSDTNVFLGSDRDLPEERALDAIIDRLETQAGAGFDFRWLTNKMLSDSLVSRMFMKSGDDIISDSSIGRTVK